MTKFFSLFLILIASVSLSCLALAESEAGHTEDHLKKAQAVTTLSPAIRELLTQEMKSIQKSMAEMLPLIVSGDWHSVSQHAAKIAAGHIMKQKLTAAQAQELMATLPQGFKELDNSFHSAANMMSHVAKEQHIELVTFYYYRLTESCIGCHSQYATHRFPALIKEPAGGQHSHAPEKPLHDQPHSH